MSIEILENTLIKLLVRRGTDNDRGNIILESGELGFTTDTQDLYIGDGATKGGLIVGNKYKGKAGNVTSLAPCVTGDYAFETDTNTLKILQGGTGSNATSVYSIPFTGERLSQTVRGQSFSLRAISSTTLFGSNDTLTTTLTLTGLDSGARITVPVTISKTVTATSFTSTATQGRVL